MRSECKEPSKLTAEATAKQQTVERLTWQQACARLGVDDPQLLAAFAQLGQVQQLPAATALVRPGDRPTHFYLVLAGLIRYYYLAPDGKQWNKAFFREGQFVGSLSAYLLEQPCRYAIETLEPAELFVLPLSFLREQALQFPKLKALFEQVVIQIMLRNEDREAMLLTCNHEQRYRWVQQREPWLLKRVAQYQLASYLSMEPVSLSRIKRRLEAD